MNIGIVFLLFATFLIVYIFARGSIAFWKYYRLLQSNSGAEGLVIRQHFPKNSVWMKVLFFMAAVGLGFSALAASSVFVYYAWRLFSNT